MRRRSGIVGSRRNGAALIITLAFIVLLASLLIIFFTQALSFRTQANSNYNDFKSATLGQSALETVMGDLEQEMTNGASATSVFSSGTNILYSVTNNANAIPRRSGNPPLVGLVDPVPNLVRISVRSDPIAFPGVGSRASAASSTNAAYGGQYISPARWNKHYLVPRASSGSASVDTTPVAAFAKAAPDWVFVTDQGPSVLATPSTKVVGRYAYAIYDEGGLLDANVAGSPSGTVVNAKHPASPNTGNMVIWGSGTKGAEALPI